MNLRPTSRSEHVRSGVYALVFAPVALIFMGSSMADLQAQAAVGLPLASVEGLIGVALATIILALVSLNCEESPAGMYVTSALSIPIGLSQAAGYLRVPLLQSTIFDLPDMRSSVLWSLYPPVGHSNHRMCRGCADVCALPGSQNRFSGSLSCNYRASAHVGGLVVDPRNADCVGALCLSGTE